MTVAELRRRMTTAEFVQWVAFYSVEAQEQERAQKRAQKRKK